MAMLKVGPYPPPRFSFGGVSEEIVWDEEGRTQIAQIFISYGEVISSIAFRYIQDNKLVTSPWFGHDKLNAPNFVTVMLKEAANNEYVTGVSGSFGRYGTTEGLIKLTIKTNVGTYGPFGDPHMYGTEFEFSFGPENQFGGFHGTYTPTSLRSIEVYVNPIHNLATLSKSKRPRLSIE